MTTSNRELSETAQKLASELGEDVPKTDGLKNEQLSKLVEELTAKLVAKKANEASGLPTGDNNNGPRGEGQAQADALTGDAVREDGTVARVGEIDPMRVGGGEPAKPGGAGGEVHTYTNDPSISERNGTAETALDHSRERSSEQLGQAGSLGTTSRASETPTHKVAQGRSVTTLRGIIGEGQEVSARDFAGGAENLRTLVESGVVEKS